MPTRIIRKRSPRAPLVSLKEAVDRACKVYEKEGRHAASADIVANHLGYKSADNGAAKQVIAALGYYGLLDRPSEGMLAVNKSVEEFKFSPSEEHSLEILQKWLRAPGVFAELIEKFQDRLPSEASLKFELIQKGFNPATAGECLTAFMESVEFVNQAKRSSPPDASAPEAVVTKPDSEYPPENTITQNQPEVPDRLNEPVALHGATVAPVIAGDEGADRIPVRLAGNRRAWLVIPSPFYAADKRRLISQIELLLADDEE